ncbi:MAG: guanylate kinase [Neisseriaceae bacterium]|nr:guanylate kinase [Neisseriaceae bacterium]MBR1818938.1 guanylate kinase [Neisseriaceae bacterium]
MADKGTVFIVSAASGTGKTSLTTALTARNDNIQVAVSHTTRKPRESEINGVHYHFVDTATFEQMIGDGAFIEHANVHGNFYGTSTREVEKIINQGIDVILEIDVQGAEQVRRQMPDAVSIFILPPSLEALKQRLFERGTEDIETLNLRINNARLEFEQASLFDYLVVNDDLPTATQDLMTIVYATRLRQSNNNEALISLLQN